MTNGYGPPATQGSDPWEQYEREGFNKLESFRGRVRQAYWSPPSSEDFGIQLVLDVNVDFVQAPVEAQGQTTTRLYYSLGRKNDFQVSDLIYAEDGTCLGGTTLYSPSSQASGVEAGFTKTSKFWMLVRRSIDIRAGVSQRGSIFDARVWNDLHADWVLEPVEYKSRTIEDSDITLPKALASQVAAPPQQMMPPPAMGVGAPQVTPMAPPAPMAMPPTPGMPAPAAQAAPAPAPVAQPAVPAPAGPIVDFDALVVGGWPAYLVSIIKGQPVAQAKTIVQRDPAASGNSVVMTAVFNGNMLETMVEQGWLTTDGVNYQPGPKAG